MSHVLLEDDDARKRELLLGLVGFCLPSVWKEAADRSMAGAGKVGPYRGTGESVESIRRQAQGESGKEAVSLLDQAQARAEAMRDHYASHNYPQAVEDSRELKTALTRAYALVQTTRAGEFRGVWDHEGTGLYPGDWPRTARLLAGAGMTAVFPNIAWGGVAHYAGAVLPLSFSAGQYGDQLKACVTACRREGLEVHAWIVCWNLGPSPRAEVDRLRRAGRLMQTDKGDTLEWLCSSDPSNRARLAESAGEIARRYEVAGVHLDYIRYPAANACFCSGCRERFGRSQGKDPAGWPASARSGGLAEAYRAWRCAQVTAAVRQVRDAVRKANPQVKLSAAVWPGYPDTRAGIGQDWGAWLKSGDVDFVCPMDYAEELAAFGGMLDRQLALPGAKGRVYPGIGVTSAESRLPPDQVIEQIRRTRQAGVPGFILFDLNPTLAREVLPLLGAGLTRPAGR